MILRGGFRRGGDFPPGKHLYNNSFGSRVQTLSLGNIALSEVSRWHGANPMTATVLAVAVGGVYTSITCKFCPACKLDLIWHVDLLPLMFPSSPAYKHVLLLLYLSQVVQVGHQEVLLEAVELLASVVSGCSHLGGHWGFPCFVRMLKVASL